MAGLRGLSTGYVAARAGATLAEITTARAVIRLARPGMEGPVADFLATNFPGHLDRWSPPVGPGFFTEGFWREKLRLGVEEFHTDRSVRLVIQLRGSDDARLPIDAPVVGTCNFTNIVRGPMQACHLGYQVALAQQGKGLMQEALTAAIAYMFNERRMHRIMANYRPENYRSAKLLQRLGFRREGLAENYLFIDGAWRDHVLTALVNPEFDPAWIESAGR